MQGTADFHHHITPPVLPHPDGLCEHAAAFDTAIDMFDAHPASSDGAVVCFLCGRQRLPAWLLRRLEDLHALQCEALKAQVLQQLTPRRQWRRGRIGQARVVDASRMGRTQEHHAQRGIAQQQVFQPRPLFLAAITRLLFRRVCGARDGSLGAIRPQRGALRVERRGRLPTALTPRAEAPAPSQGVGARPRHGGRADPPRCARRDATPAGSHASMASLWTDACRTRVHGAGEWDAA